MPPISVRIEWCRQRSRLAGSEPEADAWQAEADGLRDAVMNRDHSGDYRFCSPEIRERYLLGLQDGIAMLLTMEFHKQFHGKRSGHDREVTDELPTMQWARGL